MQLTLKDKLLPCPFCGTDDIKYLTQGTQASLGCYNCGCAEIGVQTSDLIECTEDDSWIGRSMSYSLKHQQRALDYMVVTWNTRK